MSGGLLGPLSHVLILPEVQVGERFSTTITLVADIEIWDENSKHHQSKYHYDWIVM
jgi:hypothetical protein